MPIDINIPKNTTNYTKIIRVKESKEFMEVLGKITDILENNIDRMEDVVYLNMYNELMNLYCLDLTMDIIIKSGGRVINQNKVHIPYEQKRKAVENGNPRLTCCDLCLRVISKSGVKQHQKSEVCKDNRVVFKATQANLMDANARAVDEYILGMSD